MGILLEKNLLKEYKLWQGGNHKRIYISQIPSKINFKEFIKNNDFGIGLGKGLGVTKRAKCVEKLGNISELKIYYDCNDENFYFISQHSDTLKKFIGLFTDEIIEMYSKEIYEEDNVSQEIKENSFNVLTLNGSEKQVEWANEIRDNVLNFVDELEKIKMKKIKDGDHKVKDKSIEEMTEKCKRKFKRIKEGMRSIESAKFFIDNFKDILEHNSLEQKAFHINQTLKNSQFVEESKIWSLLEYETQVPHKLKKVKDYNISYEEAKKIAREIKFNNTWANEIKENVLKIVEIFDEIIKQVPNASTEKTKELIIETLIQENPRYFINGFKEIKESKVESIRKIEEISRKIELIWHLFYRGVNC
ncbi:TPA: hypothetical protein KRE09_002325 [Clostridioides difficile]|uniref:hypothetical protein n=1 Tax=Clostridioides difficile TaxID=1496 RepID=UPI0005B37C77|nr:hypothetical protein [Clostridioides difficile]AUO78365.1 hypothetical protein LIBA6276_00147 [Clostridioides phage LIBA6276]EJX3365459.1 hypothetical protein [Clostridioides difficile]EJX3377982.1 hypothetical protein [Clostridioides difficile]MBN6006845.1 hypothetical protein [Clostridioides difficile]MCG3625861.1 hypothetical protein [Clostridioides difficile]